MKKINSYNNVSNMDIGIRVNANESYKNISDDELKDIVEDVIKLKFNRYPDSDCDELREIYSKVVGVNKENLIAGNGSDEMISLIISSQITRKKVVLTINPDFSMYDFYTSVSEGVIKKYNTEKDGSFSVNKFINFEDYSSAELIDILEGMCKKQEYKISEESKTFLIEKFDKILEDVPDGFANARTVRNLLEFAITNQAARIVNEENLDEEKLMTLELDDIKDFILN